jgi:hypothetical protein
VPVPFSVPQGKLLALEAIYMMNTPQKRSVSKRKLLRESTILLGVIFATALMVLAMGFIPIRFSSPPQNVVVLIDFQQMKILPPHAPFDRHSAKLVSWKEATDLKYSIDDPSRFHVYAPSFLIYVYERHAKNTNATLRWVETDDEVGYRDY